MNIYQQRKAVIAMCAVLFSAFCVTGVSAQLLKPGEIIYSRVDTGTNGGGCAGARIWAVGQNGANDRTITQGLHPRLSPDGRYLLFKRFASNVACLPFNNGAPQFWVRDLATRRETQIAENFRTAFGHYFSPATNRADSQIILDDTGTLCTMNLDGTNRTCYYGMTSPIRFARHPTVRGGDNLVVVGDYDSNYRETSGLYTLNYDISNRVKIPNTFYGDSNPSWSNDGQRIAYAFLPNSGGGPYFFSNLFTIKPDGTNKTQLTFLDPPHGEGFSHSLVWTPDNTVILNAARINGIAGIYRIAADGSGTILGTIPITPGVAPEWVGGIAPVYGEQQIASFGGGAVTNGNFNLVDTIGQSFAGQTSMGGTFNLQSGFHTYRINPTAAAVSISGNITSGKRGISKAIVYLTPPSGETRQTTVDLWGNFSFEDVRAGETYVINVFHKRYTFQAQVVTANDNITDLIFAAQ